VPTDVGASPVVVARQRADCIHLPLAPAGWRMDRIVVLLGFLMIARRYVGDRFRSAVGDALAQRRPA